MTKQTTLISTQEIMDMLPHRFPFLMIDQFEITEGEEFGVGIKNVTNTESWVPGHFPGNPVFPGVLIIEAIAQSVATAVIYNARAQDTSIDVTTIYLMAVDNARFRHPVFPGDQLRFYVEQLHKRGNIYKFKGLAKVGDKLAAEAVIVAMNYEPKT